MPKIALSPLKRSRTQPGWHSLALRVGLAFGLIAVAFALLWFDRAGLRDNIDGHLSFSDVIYFTMITITTVGYGDIVPVSERARLIDAFLITPIRLFVWLIFLGTAFNFLFKRSWEKWRMNIIQRGLRDHHILAGFGHSGRKALEELVSSGTSPDQIVIVECSPEGIEAARETGAATIQGDASRDEILRAVHIERAKTLIVSAGRDDTSILIVLTARHLSPSLRIAVAIRNSDNEDIARQAGANVVVNPVSFTGLLLASSTHGEYVADYIADLTTSTGTVTLRERRVESDEIGKSLRESGKGIGVRLYRGGVAYSALSAEAARLEKDDMILEIASDPEVLLT